jgi:hypothetical protein
MISMVHISQFLILSFAVWANEIQPPPSPAELKARVAYADRHFAEGSKPGSQTDRGRVYIGLGPADYIKNMDMPVRSGSFEMHVDMEIWTYKKLPGITNDIDISFVDFKLDATREYKIMQMKSVDGGEENEYVRSYNQLMQQIEETLKRVPKE